MTYCTMIATDGTESVYGVYRVPARSGAPRKLNMARAELVDTYRTASMRGGVDGVRAWCYARAAEHATPEWPAFEWGVVTDASGRITECGGRPIVGTHDACGGLVAYHSGPSAGYHWCTACLASGALRPMPVTLYSEVRP